MGGDALHLIQYIKDEDVSLHAERLRLAVSKQLTEREDLLWPAHSVTESVNSDISSDTTDTLIGHTEYKTSQKLRLLLGKLHKMPSTRTEGRKKILAVDAAFVKYPHPHTPGCSLTWQDDGEKFCLDDTDQDNYIDRVSPLVIRGRNGDIYQVTGSQRPTRGLEVTYSGAVTGPGKKTGVVGEKFLLVTEKSKGYMSPTFMQFLHT